MGQLRRATTVQAGGGGGWYTVAGGDDTGELGLRRCGGGVGRRPGIAARQRECKEGRKKKLRKKGEWGRGERDKVERYTYI